MRQIIRWGAVCSSIFGIVLSLLFIVNNPFSEVVLSITTKWIVVFMLVLPSIFMLISVLYNRLFFMILSFVWLVPYSLYMAVATIPSIWNFFVIFLFFQFLSLIALYNARKNPTPS